MKFFLVVLLFLGSAFASAEIKVLGRALVERSQRLIVNAENDEQKKRIMPWIYFSNILAQSSEVMAVTDENFVALTPHQRNLIGGVFSQFNADGEPLAVAGYNFVTNKFYVDPSLDFRINLSYFIHERAHQYRRFHPASQAAIAEIVALSENEFSTIEEIRLKLLEYAAGEEYFAIVTQTAALQANQSFFEGNKVSMAWHSALVDELRFSLFDGSKNNERAAMPSRTRLEIDFEMKLPILNNWYAQNSTWDVIANVYGFQKIPGFHFNKIDIKPYDIGEYRVPSISCRTYQRLIESLTAPLTGLPFAVDIIDKETCKVGHEPRPFPGGNGSHSRTTAPVSIKGVKKPADWKDKAEIRELRPVDLPKGHICPGLQPN